jgi:peptide/nickel transport system permease protein
MAATTSTVQGLYTKPRRLAWRRFARSRTAQLGLFVTVMLVMLSVGAPLITPIDPTDMDSTAILRSASAAHPLGTDDFGRDLLSRVLYGARVSILVGIIVAGVTTVTGVVLGALAGFYPRLDNPIMRVMDILMAFPEILLALGIMAILGPQLANIIIALIIAYTPRPARLLRGMILMLKELDFVTAARTLGAADLRIILRHLLPNAMAPLMVQQTFILAIAILAESALNFLGVGAPPEVPTLGGILSDSRIYLRSAPWMSLYPGVYISLLVLGFNLLGDGLRDVLDPQMKV